MTQEAIQITETPPLPGLKLVQDLNKALQTLATDFAGSSDPAALAGPFMTWADTGNMLLKRRNAANTAWVSEGALFSGLKGIASTLEAQALTADDVVITPKKLADAFGGANQGLTSNGYQKLPGGLIIQWGSVAAGVPDDADVSLPISFPSQIYAVIAICEGALSDEESISCYWDRSATTLSTIRVARRYANDGGMVGVATQGYSYIAIGQ